MDTEQNLDNDKSIISSLCSTFDVLLFDNLSNTSKEIIKDFLKKFKYEKTYNAQNAFITMLNNHIYQQPQTKINILLTLAIFLQ